MREYIITTKKIDPRKQQAKREKERKFLCYLPVSSCPESSVLGLQDNDQGPNRELYLWFIILALG